MQQFSVEICICESTKLSADELHEKLCQLLCEEHPELFADVRVAADAIEIVDDFDADARLA